MKRRRTLLIIQPGPSGLAISRGRTVDVFTCRQAATALGVSLRWVHRYVRRRPVILYHIGRPLLWRAEVAHLQRWLALRRIESQRQRSLPPRVSSRRP